MSSGFVLEAARVRGEKLRTLWASKSVEEFDVHSEKVRAGHRVHLAHLAEQERAEEKKVLDCGGYDDDDEDAQDNDERDFFIEDED